MTLPTRVHWVKERGKMLEQNYLSLLEEIEHRHANSAHADQECQLIAVSKTQEIPKLERLYNIGCRHFGENKVQELMDKYEQLPKDIKWHMIGHLQTNKVKYIVDKVFMIHSVDSLKLATMIDKEAKKKNCVVNILIELNVAEEESKFGILQDEVLSLVEEVAKLEAVKICGLMTIAPYVEDSEENRHVFSQLYQLLVDIKTKKIDNVNMNMLSMGMTGDYLIAIDEGANYVRVGTGIFGEREYI